MDTVDRLDLAAAGFREQASWLAELSEKMEVPDGPLYEEVDASLHRLHDLYQEAQEAYLVSTAWEMEVDMYEDQDEIGPAVARREREEAQDIIQAYREGKEHVDRAADSLEAFGIDVWERIDPDTRLYDPDEYVDDMEFDISFDSPAFTVIDSMDSIYSSAAGVYDQLSG